MSRFWRWVLMIFITFMTGWAVFELAVIFIVGDVMFALTSSLRPAILLTPLGTVIVYKLRGPLGRLADRRTAEERLEALEQEQKDAVTAEQKREVGF